MIAKGNLHANGVNLAAYLVKAHPGERGELIDTRGFGPVSDLRDGFRIEHIRARDGTRAEKPFFHVHLRGAEGEGAKLSREDWLAIADRVDKALGRHMDEQPRAASLHVNRETGDMHLHLGYSLVRESDDGRLYVQKLGLYKHRLKEVSRTIERDYGLKILSNERRADDLARAAGRDEFEEARRLGTDLKAIRSTILDCFRQSDTGKAFQAALGDHGMQIAKGDRRDCFVVIDAAGGQHALNKKLTGLTLAETRGRLGDLDRALLPGVEQAKEHQAARAAEAAQEREKHGRGADRAELAPDLIRGQGNTLSEGPPRSPQPEIKPLGKTAGEIRLAWQLTKTADQFAQAIEDRGLILVHVSREEAENSHRAAAFAKAIGRQNRALKEGFAVVDARGNVTRIDQRTTGDLWEEIQKRLAGIDQRELLSVADAKDAMREANRIEWREQRRAERDAARPATAIEQTIFDAAQDAAGDNQKFAEALAKEGLTLARATAADVTALDALRQEQELTGIVADAAGITRDKARHFARLEEGDLAAVNRRGDVVRLDPQHLEPVAGRAAETAPLPAVTEARAAFEIERADAAEFQQVMIDLQMQRQAEAAASRQPWEPAKPEMAPAAPDRGVRDAGDAVGRLGASFVALLAGALNFFGDMFAPPPRPTRDQAERAERVAEEQATARQTAAEDAQHWALLDRLKGDDMALRRQLEEQLKRDLAARERDDDYYRGRERDR